MNKQEILEAIRNLALSQGFYGQLLDQIYDDETEEILDELEAQNFKDVVDLIMYIEQ